MPISIKRVYDPVTNADGVRILVDRLWPRGIPKDKLKLDDWLKDVAPSAELRKSYHDGRIGWGEFRRRYLGELKNHRKALRPLAIQSKNGPVTLLFSASDEKHNNAVVLKQYLGMLARS